MRTILDEILLGTEISSESTEVITSTEDAKKIQRDLNELFGLQLVVDGNLGKVDSKTSKSREAIRLFQELAGLAVTGKVDDTTRNKLNTVLPLNRAIGSQNRFFIFNFEVDKYEIKKEQRITICKAKEKTFQLWNQKKIDTILFMGHTDKTGTTDHNQKLSENRATEIWSHWGTAIQCDDRFELDKTEVKIAKIGFGSDHLIPSTSNSENRRVVLALIKMQAKPGLNEKEPKKETPKEIAKKNIESALNELSSPSPWKGTNVNDVKKRLLELIDDPDKFNQNPLPLCGPAAFFRQWTKNSPIQFANFAVDLYKFGQAKIGSYLISPVTERKNPGGKNLIDTNYSKEAPKTIRAADWYLMSSLRNQENGVFDFQGTEGENVSAITYPKDLVRWLSATSLYKNISDEVNLFFSKSYSDTVSYSPGKSDVYLFINSYMLGNDAKAGKKEPFSIVDHIVVLDSKIILKNNHVSLTVWSWAELYHLDLRKDVFEDNFYGAVIATKR